MAYNKYDSDKHAVPYMAGIPVKISEQYKPPKKITLPGAVINKLNADSVLPEYDFTLEKSITDKMCQWRLLRQSQREMRRKRLEVEKKVREVTEQAAATEEQSPPERAVSPPTSKPYPILTPVPIHASTNSQSTSHSRSFNISEFEQDTASPFDNMELKTINDMEELAHVLQPAVISDKSEPAIKEEKTTQPRLNGYNNHFECFDSSKWTSSYSQVCSPHPSWYREPNPTLPRVPPSNPPIQSYVVQRLDVGEQSSNSVPDIVQQLELELRGKREAESRKNQEQPLRPASIGPAEFSSKSDCHSNTTQPPKPSCSLPNPYSQLSTVCQQLSDRLAEMGFPLPRVARAAQLFGDDETRIVEFLVQVQRLEEMNYSADLAEKALIANDHKQTETVQYLNILSQLMDLGFAKEKVEQALTECGSDRDKALDLLIS